MHERADDVLAHMEQLGAQTVRDMIASGRWPANYSALAKAWLHQKDAEEQDRKDAHKAETVLVAQRSNELSRSAVDAARQAGDVARSANDAAIEANRLVGDANTAAQEANSMARDAARIAHTNSIIAIVSLVAALIAMAISIIAIFVKK